MQGEEEPFLDKKVPPPPAPPPPPKNFWDKGIDNAHADSEISIAKRQQSRVQSKFSEVKRMKTKPQSGAGIS